MVVKVTQSEEEHAVQEEEHLEFSAASLPPHQRQVPQQALQPQAYSAPRLVLAAVLLAASGPRRRSPLQLRLLPVALVFLEQEPVLLLLLQRPAELRSGQDRVRPYSAGERPRAAWQAPAPHRRVGRQLVYRQRVSVLEGASAV